MKPYVQLATDSPEEFLRTVGLSQADVHHLNDNLAAIDTQKALPPDKTRTESPQLPREDRLLLTL